MHSRIVTLIIVIALIAITIPIKLSGTVEAEPLTMPEDPVDTAIAPHFSRVIYTTEEPSYSTSCDARGDFKASVGTPTISLSNSRLNITASAATRSRVVLATTDAPELNQTRAYYELGLQVSNTLAYVNISLYDTSANDWVNLSVQSGAWYYDYDSGSQQKGALYSPAAIETDYIIAFELTTSSVTLYLYSSTGTALADKYIATNLLVGGDLDEIRFELAGATSNVLSIDYFYALGSKPASREVSTSASLGTLVSDQEFDESRVDLDPTTVDLDQTLREEMFGFEEQALGKTVTKEDLITQIGTQSIHQQRAAGRLTAEGYTDLKDSVEDALIDYIAVLEGCDETDVYLIDYYIDYLQMKVKVDREIVDRITGTFDRFAEPMVEAFGARVDDTSTASTSSVPAYAQAAEDLDNAYLETTLYVPVFLSDLCRGVGDFLSDPLGIKSSQEEMFDYLQEQQQKVEDVYNSALARADWAYNDTKDALIAFQQSTDEKFDQVYGLLLNYMSVSQAQFSEMCSSYDEVVDKFERQISSYYAYTQQQFEATNQIIAQLLWQNSELQEAQTQLTQYFAGQLAKTNEVIMNLTSTLTSQLDATDFWADVMSDGKPAAEPLTFSSFFGNNVTTWVWVIVLVFVSLLVVVALVVFLRKGKRKGRSKT